MSFQSEGGDPVRDALEQWGPRIYHFALRLCRNPHLAEDLAQETLLRAWRQQEDLRNNKAIRVWLFRITANLWKDHLRRQQSAGSRTTVSLDEVPSPSLSVEQNLVQQETLNETLQALDALPSRQREVLFLNAYEGLSSVDIAEVLQITPDAVRASLAIARRTLRQRLAPLVPHSSTETTP